MPSLGLMTYRSGSANSLYCRWRGALRLVLVFARLVEVQFGSLRELPEPRERVLGRQGCRSSRTEGFGMTAIG